MAKVVLDVGKVVLDVAKVVLDVGCISPYFRDPSGSFLLMHTMTLGTQQLPPLVWCIALFSLLDLASFAQFLIFFEGSIQAPTFKLLFSFTFKLLCS